METPVFLKIGENVSDKNILPSNALKTFDFGLPEILPLFARRPNGELIQLNTLAIGKEKNGYWQNFGFAKNFEILPLDDVLPMLDKLGEMYKFMSIGTIMNNSALFICYAMRTTEMVGEQYQEYLIYIHSYKPGLANCIFWSPVRIACQNALFAAESQAKMRISIEHNRQIRELTDASFLIAQIYKLSESFKHKLERLAALRLDPKTIDYVLDKTYNVYLPRNAKTVREMKDFIPETTYELFQPDFNQEKYVKNLKERAKEEIELFGLENPQLAMTGYAVYNSIVKIADHRRGKKQAAESAAFGARMLEKSRALQAIMSFLP